MLKLTDKDEFTTFYIEPNVKYGGFDIMIHQGNDNSVVLDSNEDLDTLKTIIKYCENN